MMNSKKGAGRSKKGCHVAVQVSNWKQAMRKNTNRTFLLVRMLELGVHGMVVHVADDRVYIDESLFDTRIRQLL